MSVLMWSSSTILLLLSYFPFVSGNALPTAGGAALAFDGSDDFAVVFPTFTPGADWTIEAWVQPDADTLGDTQCLFSYSSFFGTNYFSLQAFNGQWRMQYGYMDVPVENTTLGEFTSEKRHVAVTHDVTGANAVLSLYLDGDLVQQTTLPVVTYDEPAGNFLLGMCGVSAPHGVSRVLPFKGEADEVRYWSVVRIISQIRAARLYSGNAGLWPVGAAGTGLVAHYTFDQLTALEAADLTGNSNNALLGGGSNPIDRPAYVASPFTELLQSARYFETRELDSAATTACPSDRCVNMSEVFEPEGAQTFQGFRVTTMPNTPGLQLFTIQGNGAATLVSAGTVLTNELLYVSSPGVASSDTFTVQKCTTTTGGCAGATSFTYVFEVLPSTRPLAGEAYSLQLLGRRGFLELQEPFTGSAGIEFWFRMDHFATDQAIFSVTQKDSGAPLLALGYYKGGLLWFHACAGTQTASTADPMPVLLTFPGFDTLEAQHIAISMEKLNQRVDAAANLVRGDYNVTLMRNCQMLTTFILNDTCTVLDSNNLTLPTLGQMYEVRSSALVPSSHASMQLGEIRVWERPLTQTEVCDRLGEPLQGVTGLQAHYPVMRTDFERNDGLIANRPILGIQGPHAVLRCTTSRIPCPDIGAERGWFVVPSVFSEQVPFERPSYVTTVGTVDGSLLPTLELPMTAYDADNWETRARTSRGLDQVSVQIIEVPSQVCGQLQVQNGSRTLTINDTASPSDLPLRFETTNAPSCTTSMRFAATDTQGLDAPETSVIDIVLKPEGPAFVSVEAFDPGLADDGLDEGDIISFLFDGATNGLLDWTLYIEVLNGSFGSANISASWNNAATTLALEILEPNDMNIVPGVTQFRVRDEVDAPVQAQGVDSYPTTGTRLLTGGFQQSQCSPGQVYRSNVGHCVSCGAGNYEDADATTCLPCQPGRFNNQDAATECIACPAGTYLLPGSEDRTVCVDAAPGFFVSEEASPYQRVCPAGMVAEEASSTRCLKCPHGADCDTSAGVYAEPRLGYFRRSDDSFVKCPGGTEACNGWQSLNGSLPLGSNNCARGSTGIWCHSCLPDYAHAYDRPRGHCLDCEFTTPARVAIVAVVESIGAWGVAAWAVHAALWGHTHMVYLRLLLNYFTMVSVLGGIEKWELEPAMGSELADAASSMLQIAFRFDGGVLAQFMTLECVFGRDRSTNGDMTEFDVQKAMLLFWIYAPLAWPIAVALIAFCIGELQFWISGRKKDLSIAKPSDRSLGLFRRSELSLGCLTRMRMQLGDCFPLVLVTWLLSLPTAIRAMAVMLACGRLEDSTDSLRLLMAPDIVCWEGDHVGWAALAIVGIFLWGILVPGILGLQMWRKRESFRTGGRARVLFGYASDGYKYKFCFWDMVVQLRRLLVILVAVWPDLSRPHQIALYQVIGVASVIMHLEVDPFDHREGRVLEQLELYGLWVFLVIITTVQVVMLHDPASKYDFVPLLFAIALIFLSFTVMTGLHNFYRGAGAGSVLKFGSFFILTVTATIITAMVAFQDATAENEFDFRQMMAFILLLFTVLINVFHILHLLLEVFGEMRRSIADAYIRRRGRRRIKRPEAPTSPNEGMGMAWTGSDGKSLKKKTLRDRFEAMMFSHEHADQAYVHYDTVNNELWLGLHSSYMHDKELTALVRRKLAAMAPFLTVNERETLCSCIHDALNYIFVELDIDNFPCATMELVLRAPFVFKHMKDLPPSALIAASLGAAQERDPTSAAGQPAASAAGVPAPGEVPGVVPPPSGEPGVVPGEAATGPAVTMGYPAEEGAIVAMQTYRDHRRQAFFLPAVLGVDMTVADFSAEIHTLTHMTKEEFTEMLQDYLEDRTTQQLVQKNGLL